jgi:beta-phosphoglucomutase-like phosphatase (HAD superfamily)
MRATLVDCDGVLADTLDDRLRFAGETCAEMGVAL